MVYERYSNRICNKLENLNKLYASLMYETVAQLSDLKGLKTKEHFRTPPAEGLESVESGYAWGGEYMNLWICGKFTSSAKFGCQITGLYHPKLLYMH